MEIGKVCRDTRTIPHNSKTVRGYKGAGCVSVCVYIYIHIHTYTYIHIYIYTYIHIYIYTYIHIYIYTYIYIYTHIVLFVSLLVYRYVYLPAYVLHAFVRNPGRAESQPQGTTAGLGFRVLKAKKQVGRLVTAGPK